jgi:hypothetical protein
MQHKKNCREHFLPIRVFLNSLNNGIQLVAKKTGTVRIKLTHFCNFSIV